MKNPILIFGVMVVGLMLMGGCHSYNTRVGVGVDYYGSYGYPAYPYAYYPYSPYAYSPYYSPYAAYYPSYPYYPYFALGFGFSNIIFDGRFMQSGRTFRGTAPPSGRSGGRVFRR
jgi:hypothetical protein